MHLAKCNWMEVEEYLKRKKTIILPVGSSEQHGPNGLICTDYLIAERLAEAAGDITGMMTAPTLNFGMSTHHLGFPGTIALRPSVYIQVLTDIFRSLARHGFEKFFIINGHGGNTPSIHAAMAEVMLDLNIKIEVLTWWHEPEIEKMTQEFFGDKNGFHGSAAEVSMTKYFLPNTVKTIPSPWKEAYPEGGWSYNPQAFRSRHQDGLIKADPSLADATKGKELFRKIVDIYVKKLKAFDQKGFIESR